MTRAERAAFLDALKTWDPRDGSTLPKGTAFRFYLLMHYSLLRRGEAWAHRAVVDRLEGEAHPNSGGTQQEW